MRPPLLSAFDPLLTGEGSIDPLGLAATYEFLADKMLPAVTVRMSRPRFLTAIAVGAFVCQNLPAETVAKDGFTPPWLVFEWFIVEGFVREQERLGPGGRIPGVMKAQRALKNQRTLNAQNYLKTATIFGFTGVFRRLARHLEILTPEGRLDERGYELLTAWSSTEELRGFLDGNAGNGAEFRMQLQRAVEQGLKSGTTTWQSTEFWRRIVDTLDPAKPNARECSFLLRLLTQHSGPPSWVSAIRSALTEQKLRIAAPEEAGFLRNLAPRVPADFASLLKAIDAYEVLCGLITDSIDWIRHLGHESRREPISIKDFHRKEVAQLCAQTPTAVREVESHVHLLEWKPEIAALLDSFRQANTPERMFQALLAHHDATQGSKGKRSWFERDREDRLVVRSDYVLAKAPPPRSRYVHEYRIPTFSGFLSELGAFK